LQHVDNISANMSTLENSQAWYPPDTVATKHITPDLASLSISGDYKEARISWIKWQDCLGLGVSKKTEKPSKPSKLKKKTTKKTEPKKNRLNRLFFLLKFSVQFRFTKPEPAKPQPNRTGSV